MTGHLGDTDLARIVAGFCTSREAGEAVLHVAVCANCHRRLLQRQPGQGRRFLVSWLEDFAASKGLEVEEAATRLPEFFSVLREEDVQEGRETLTLIRDLRGLSEAHQRLLVANSARFHTLGFLEQSLAEARDHWHSSPAEAVRWASLAVTVSERAEPSLVKVYGPAVCADAKARAWAYLGNGYRIGGKLTTAVQALAKGVRLLSDRGRASEVRAEVLALQSSLRRDERRFQEATLAAFEAAALYEKLGRRETAVLTALVGALALAESGDVDQARRKLQRLLTRLPGRSRGGRTHFYLLQNLAHTLILADRPEEAAALLPEVRELSLQLVDEPLTHTRTGWLEGRVQAQLGQPRLAEATFRNVQRVFLAAGSPYDAALVSLDLAALLIEEGQSRQAAELARDLVPIFRSRGVHREAMAAGMLVARSLSEETATVDFVQRVATYLRQARVDPRYRFPG